MKINIGPYINRLTCNIHSRYMHKKYGYFDWHENYGYLDSILEKLENATQWVYNHTLNLYLDRKKRKVKIKIDKYDTWGMSETLGLIILPMLKQLKATKQGAPNTEDCDVPDELKSTSAPAKENEWDTDSNFFKRWDYILGEMIWAFEQVVDVNSEDKFFPLEKSSFTGNLNDDVRLLEKEYKYDVVGLTEHSKRKQNGLELFGKYYLSLWD